MTSRATAQPLLLLLVLLGLAGMHTIGHPSDGVHRMVTHADAHDSATAASEAEANQRTDEHRDQMMMDPLNVCLAILAGGILLLLAAALSRLRRADPVDHHPATVSGAPGRGPPGPRLLGLTIADLSVRRT